jgi:hypothetical protein
LAGFISPDESSPLEQLTGLPPENIFFHHPRDRWMGCPNCFAERGFFSDII